MICAYCGHWHLWEGKLLNSFLNMYPDEKQKQQANWFTDLNIPRTPMTSISECQPPKNKAFSDQNRGHLGSRYMYVYIYIYICHIRK